MSKSELKLNFIIDENETSTIEKKIVHHKNSRRNKVKLSREEYNKTIIIWYLFEYLHPVEDDPMNIEFFPMPSSESLNNELSAKTIVNYINSNSVFDFYQPKENDKLNIMMEYKHPKIYNKSRPFIGNFISFIFKEEWQVNNGFDHINNCYKDLKKGKLIIN